MFTHKKKKKSEFVSLGVFISFLIAILRHINLRNRSALNGTCVNQ